MRKATALATAVLIVLTTAVAALAIETALMLRVALELLEIVSSHHG